MTGSGMPPPRTDPFPVVATAGAAPAGSDDWATVGVDCAGVGLITDEGGESVRCCVGLVPVAGVTLGRAVAAADDAGDCEALLTDVTGVGVVDLLGPPPGCDFGLAAV